MWHASDAIIINTGVNPTDVAERRMLFRIKQMVVRADIHALRGTNKRCDVCRDALHLYSELCFVCGTFSCLDCMHDDAVDGCTLCSVCGQKDLEETLLAGVRALRDSVETQ